MMDRIVEMPDTGLVTAGATAEELLKRLVHNVPERNPETGESRARRLAILLNIGIEQTWALCNWAGAAHGEPRHG